ncbi:C2 domain protein, partial [Ostertagia ostertagi]
VFQGPAAHIPLDPAFSDLISLRAVKLSQNIHADVKTHPMDGTPSLSENKIASVFEGGSPIFSYTAERFTKTYPKGLRQDSSNMHPMISWICGVQSVAMNMQTAGEELDLNTGLFRVNGNCGYVLKPEMLLKGIDPRSVFKPKVKLGIGIISAQYLPKFAPGKDIVDPYVTVQIFGAPRDELKWKTSVIRNNGFNPVWNQSFDKELYCPEIAMLRFCVKDFDTTSSNDFIGEFSIPLSSVRRGEFFFSIRKRLTQGSVLEVSVHVQ